MVKITEHGSDRNWNQIKVPWPRSLSFSQHASRPGWENVKALIWHLEAHSAGGAGEGVQGHKFRFLTFQAKAVLYCPLPRGPLVNNATVLIQVQCRKFEKYKKAERKKLKLLIA